MTSASLLLSSPPFRCPTLDSTLRSGKSPLSLVTRKGSNISLDTCPKNKLHSTTYILSTLQQSSFIQQPPSNPPSALGLVEVTPFCQRLCTYLLLVLLLGLCLQRQLLSLDQDSHESLPGRKRGATVSVDPNIWKNSGYSHPW
jgi:hypothetical protein